MLNIVSIRWSIIFLVLYFNCVYSNTLKLPYNAPFGTDSNCRWGYKEGKTLDKVDTLRRISVRKC